MRTRPALAVLGFLLASAGCGSDDGPRTPTAPSRAPVPEPTPPPPDLPIAPERRLLQLDGVFYAPGSVIELSPHNPIEIEVIAHPVPTWTIPNWLGPPAPNWAGFVVETDAPAEKLSIRRWIAWREVHETEHPDTGDPVRVGAQVGIIRLEALESGENHGSRTNPRNPDRRPRWGFPRPGGNRCGYDPVALPGGWAEPSDLLRRTDPDCSVGPPIRRSRTFFPASVRGSRRVQLRKNHGPGAGVRGWVTPSRSLPVPGR